MTGYACQPWQLRYVDHALIRDAQDAALVDPKVDTMGEVSGREPARTGHLSAG